MQKGMGNREFEVDEDGKEVDEEKNLEKREEEEKEEE